jgi:hypothetical protein
MEQRARLIRKWLLDLWEKNLTVNSSLTYEEIIANIERRAAKEKHFNVKPHLVSKLIISLFDAGKITYDEADALNNGFLIQYEDIKE